MSFEARVTALSCQWLMGPCTVNSVDLPDGSSLMTGVMLFGIQKPFPFLG